MLTIDCCIYSSAQVITRSIEFCNNMQVQRRYGRHSLDPDTRLWYVLLYLTHQQNAEQSVEPLHGARQKLGVPLMPTLIYAIQRISFSDQEIWAAGWPQDYWALFTYGAAGSLCNRSRHLLLACNSGASLINRVAKLSCQVVGQLSSTRQFHYIK
jgi:hypothetical protein